MSSAPCSVDQLDGLDASVWSTIAGHGNPIDIYSPDIQESIDVTDGRLRNLYDAFDRDFDGRLSKPELLQGLAQQGFHNLEGTREFELLWNTVYKVQAGGAGDGEVGDKDSSPELASKTDIITFAAFKRIVQRLKMELLFLPEMHQPSAASRYYQDMMDSRSVTPVPYGAPSTASASSMSAAPSSSAPGPAVVARRSATPVMVAPAPRVFSGLGGSDHTVARSDGSNVSINFGADGRVTPAGLYPDYGTVTPGLPVEDFHRTETVKFSSVDYNDKSYAAEVPVADTYSFFTAHRDPKDFMMRWLHMEGLDRLTILRFAVKYSLHPLCVEDALKLEDQQPKVNKYGAHYFIVMPFFRLSHESREALDALRQQRRRNTSILKSTADAASSLAGKGGGLDLDSSWSDFQFKVEWSKLCIFMAGPPAYDTVISLHGKWETFNNETDEITGGSSGHFSGGGGHGKHGGEHSRAHSKASVSSEAAAAMALASGGPPLGLRSRRGSAAEVRDGPVEVAGSDRKLMAEDFVAAAHSHHDRVQREREASRSRGHIFENLVTALKVDYSVLRQGNSKHLMYRILDEVVDYLIPIARAYRTRVRLFQAQLHRNERKFQKEQMRLVLGMKSELQRLQRRIRPMTAVVRHLMDDEQIGQDMKVYLEDVLDHVVRGLEEIGGCIEMCDSTKEEFKSLRDQRTNEVLYTLTVVTTMFVPLQFLTGVYGT